jgi:uncharacterized membrane protein
MPTVARMRRIRLQIAATIVACTVFGIATITSAQQSAKVQSYKEIERFSRTYPTQYLAVSGDGSTVVGSLVSDIDNWYEFYRWSPSAGMGALAGLKGKVPRPQTVSANGEAVAGFVGRGDLFIFAWSKSGGARYIAGAGWFQYPKVSFVSNDASVVVWVEYKGKIKAPEAHLMRWSKSGGVKDLGKTDTDFTVTGVSPDGSEIVGYTVVSSTKHQQGFRWNQSGGLQAFLPMEAPLGISADGSTILGVNDGHVIRWTQAGGVQDLGTLNTGTAVFSGKAASVDGTTIVGYTSAYHAFLWTQSGGSQDLGNMGGKGASLDAVSADGTVVAGNFVDTSGTTVQFVSPVTNLVAKVQSAEKEELARAQAQAAAQAEAQRKAAAAQAEQQAKNAAAAAEQQARYDKAIAKGRPAQIYSLAGDLQAEGRDDLAANLYQLLIDKFPDDPYTAKAIDKKEAAREAAAQQQQQAQDAASQPAADPATAKNVEACLQQCSSTANSCKSTAQNQHDAAVAKGLVGMLSRNAGMVGGAGSDSQSADSAKSACDDAYNSCSSACQ